MNKRIVVSAILCIALLIFLCACGTSNTETETQYANQEQFLKDMANGISKRIENSNDGAYKNDEEQFAAFEKLVAFELDMIEKYEGQTFEAELFNDLAHAYIDACQMQRIAAKNYKIQNLSDLWESARAIRSSIITELYTHYDLPISSEQAANYSIQDSGNSQVAVSMDGELDIMTGLMKYFDNMVTYDSIQIKTAKSQVLFDHDGIKITLKSLEENNGNYTVNMTISNSLVSEKVTCYIGSGSIDDYQILMSCPWGYYWANAGKKCDTFSELSGSSLKDIGKENFKMLSAYLFVLTTDGATEQVIAKVPITIDRSAFGS